MGSKKGRKRGEKTEETTTVSDNGEIVLRNGTDVDLNGCEGDEVARKRNFVQRNVMGDREEDQRDGRKVDEERRKKKKEKKEKYKEGEIDVNELQSKDGKSYNCCLGEVRDNGNVKDTKLNGKKKRKVEVLGGKKGSVDYRMEKIKKKHKVDKHQDKVKVEPNQEEEREGETNDKFKHKMKKRKKSDKMQKNCFKGNNQEKKDDDVPTGEAVEATPAKVASKKVAFSDMVEVFPLENSKPKEVVFGVRYTKEEDELLKKAIFEYIEFHGLGEDGVEKLLNCRKYNLRGSWREIAKSLPWRDCYSVYRRGILLLTKGDGKVNWKPEEFELILEYHKKHGSKWSALAKALGRYRYDVKDVFRFKGNSQIRKGRWAPEELDALYDLVNKDLRLGLTHGRKTHWGMIRENIAWTSISEQLGTRKFDSCCQKWYNISSPMVSQNIWADTDDYRLVNALAKLDACSFVEVDWDNLLEHRSGELCVRRWKELIRTVDRYYAKSFMELVETLVQRYSWDVLEAREALNEGREEAS